VVQTTLALQPSSRSQRCCSWSQAGGSRPAEPLRMHSNCSTQQVSASWPLSRVRRSCAPCIAISPPLVTVAAGLDVLAQPSTWAVKIATPNVHTVDVGSKGAPARKAVSPRRASSKVRGLRRVNHTPEGLDGVHAGQRVRGTQGISDATILGSTTHAFRQRRRRGRQGCTR
jgi:hypothetical protein